MHLKRLTLAVLVGIQCLVFAVRTAWAETKELGGGFLHHGMATSASKHRGTVATIDGVADHRRFFVFDPATRKIVHEKDTVAEFGVTNSQQGPRVFVVGPDKTIYMLFSRGIARVEPATFRIAMLAKSPVPIGPGGDILDGRIYFASGAHVYSYGLAK